jgi:hypothetical protein
VTTGTGSGKSLCFFIPIIDSIISPAGAVGVSPAHAEILKIRLPVRVARVTPLGGARRSAAASTNSASTVS